MPTQTTNERNNLLIRRHVRRRQRRRCGIPGVLFLLLALFASKPAPAARVWHSHLDGNAADTVAARDGTIPASTLPNNAPAAAADRNGNAGAAVFFDGNDLFQIDKSALPQTLTAGTLMFWVRPDDIQVEHGIVAVGATGAGTSQYFSIMARGLTGEPIIRGDLDDGSARRDALGPIVVGEWHHAALVFDGNVRLSLYLDGRRVAETDGSAGDTVAAVTPDRDWLIGAERSIALGDPDDRHLIGALDDVGIYDNAVDERTIALAHGLGRFVGLNQTDAGIGDVLAAFQLGPGSSAQAGGRTWHVLDTAFLPDGEIGETSGTLDDENAYIILDSSGAGVSIDPDGFAPPPLPPAQFPNQAYDESLLYTIVSPTMGAAHHNQPAALDNYVILCGNAVHEIWNIDDPFNPVHIRDLVSPYRFGEAESHTVSFVKHPDGKVFMATISGRGIDLWDMSNMPHPVLLNAMELPGINYGDTSSAVWGVSWQGDYIYVGATDRGIHVVDAAVPTSPSLVTTVPTSAFGGVIAGPVFAMGNLLIVVTPKGKAGVATLDIGNPAAPSPLDFVKLLGASYIGWFYGQYAYLINPIRPFSVLENPLDIRQLAEIPDPGKVEYIQFSDDIMFVGGVRNLPGVYKYDNTDPLDPDFIARIPGRPIDGTDDQFSLAVGNLLVVSDDQANNGSFIAVHDTAPDTKPPRVVAINPPDGATNRPLTTRIGLSLSDHVDLNTVTSGTFLVREFGGAPLAGKWGLTHCVLNFWPDEPLEPDTTYEVLLPADGIADYVGNRFAAEFRATFSTGATLDAFDCTLDPFPPIQAGESTDFTGAADGENLQFSWDFGDGTTTTLSPVLAISHLYAEPGRYPVTLTMTNGAQLLKRSQVQIVHRPLTVDQPTRSRTIVVDDLRDRVWCVNPDSNSVSVIDAASLTKIMEIPVGIEPKTLAQDPVTGVVWVVCQDSDEIRVLDPDDGATLAAIPLDDASRPHGIAFTPDGGRALVTLEAKAGLAAIDTTTHERIASSYLDTLASEIIVKNRGIAVTADGLEALVTAFNPQFDAGGELLGAVGRYDVATLTPAPMIFLGNSTRPDTTFTGRGIPNYLNSIAISPDGRQAWVPSKQDNIARGLARDGIDLTEESSVRAIVSLIDLESHGELLDRRIDINDSDLPYDVAFSPLGDLAFVAVQGSNRVSIHNAYTGEAIGNLQTGLAPQGLDLSADGRLFVMNFMSRSVSVFDVSEILAARNNITEEIARIDVVADELLSPNVLLGKRIFYNAVDPRMNSEGYISCASCHLDGGGDATVWDFTGRGEGLRDTITLRGRGGMRHGPVHWTGNFDEIQDFENDIRFHFGGLGFMADADFAAGARSNPLGDPKAGLQPELDALAAYVATLDDVPRSPHRNPDGSLTDDGLAGRAVFAARDCLSCHVGPNFTDSAPGVLHNVGTIKPASGQRIGGPLTGLDTPTLKGSWNTAPYLHDGSAKGLADVIEIEGHGNARSLDQSDKDRLIAYLLQIDERSTTDFAEAPEPSGIAIYKLERDARDSSGNENHGAVPAQSTFAPGRIDAWALRIDGEADAASVPPTIRDDFSILFWLRATGLAADGAQWRVGAGLVDASPPSPAPLPADDFGVSMLGNLIAFGIGDAGGGDVTVRSTTPVNDGLWHHIAVTRDGATGEIEVFVDGAREATALASTGRKTAADTIRVGVRQSGASAVTAVLDHLRLYDWKLEEADVEQIYLNDLAEPGNTVPPAVWKNY
jgi:YVTN family beta-propeller protein